jgi:hypothetical protein
MIKHLFTRTGMIPKGATESIQYHSHYFNTIEQILQDYEDAGILPERDISTHIYEAHVFGWFYEVIRGAFDANHLFYRDLTHSKHAKNFADKLELLELSQTFDELLLELAKLPCDIAQSLIYHDLHSNPQRYPELYLKLTKLEKLIRNDVEKGDFENYIHGPLFQMAEEYAKQTCPIEVLEETKYREKLEIEISSINK